MPFDGRSGSIQPELAGSVIPDSICIQKIGKCRMVVVHHNNKCLKTCLGHPSQPVTCQAMHFGLMQSLYSDKII